MVLSDEPDAYGLHRLTIDFRYSLADAEPIVRTHKCFAEWLSDRKLGTLQWSVPMEERVSHIISQARDGRHQIGTTQMGHTENTGVVDRDCRVFGVNNLFVAGTSVFASSGHANPTLTAVALAMRLAQKLTSSQSVEVSNLNFV